ncbi:DNA primase [Bacillus phage vB_BanS_Chewbecca]|uniref:DNA primase n=1 Tax=Bacillus phage vB_BanS_Chewbecca TaxID=2894786 RepID=A0AAE8YNX5_9CAUD|nr:DNA primase [Bacillus phage vB_BanS_Chewbecca]UGO46151.1 DNA primase [Bacillus phage vB_BanS_Chewbecca]
MAVEVVIMSKFSDLKEIKKRILREDKLEAVLEALECDNIRTEQRGYLYTARLPEHYHSNNPRAVQAKTNDDISCSIRNRSFSGDIFNLVSYLAHNKRNDEVQQDLSHAKRFICELFGWNEYLDGTVKRRTDFTACLKNIIKNRKRRVEIKPNPVLPETMLDDYYYYGKALPFEGWIEEGISYDTQMMYGIGFDLDSKRITIPMRNRFGQLVGVKGRIMNDEDDDRKYIYLCRYQNRFEWFNFWYAHQYILMERKVYIVESEKSCMKLFDQGIYNSVAIGASEISEEQAYMIKQLGLDIEIVLCYDKGIKIEDIKKNAEMFEGRTVTAMFDTDDLLDDKDAPIDKGIEIWRKLESEYVFELD